MASASVTPSSSADGLAAATAPHTRDRRRRQNTTHLKHVPEAKQLREQIRHRCDEVAARLDKAHPLSKDTVESIARAALAEMGLPEGYIGWTMVMLASAFWRDQVAAVPPSRRLFLLPHCLKHTESCRAHYDEFGLDCKSCGACSIGDFRSMALDLGYRVLVAEGSPIVMKIILSGYVDAILGVACLNVLEKAIDKVLLAGIPCIAVPLLSSKCKATSVDEDWVRDMIQLPYTAASSTTRTYMHIMRAASSMFEHEALDRCAPRLRGGPRLSELNGQGIAAIEPIAATEAIAYDFLAKGGKYSRPFITLAVHDAMTGGFGTGPDGAQHVAQLPDAIFRAAMSIETFHKASLVHDDIEDNDAFRYGEQTVHRRYGMATAINVGDYLIGMGYRLVSRESRTLGPEAVSEILDCLADAHTKLSEGQGAELLWRDSLDKRLKPIDALKIYALKTAPAFEAAILTGIRLAAPCQTYVAPVRQFARNLGVAFQILNDLNDWRGDEHNKLAAGGDILGGRPTILWALALEALDEQGQRQLRALIADDSQTPAQRVSYVRRLYHETGVFEKACRLIDKHQQRAETVANEIEPEELRRLFQYLIDTVLARPDDFTVQIEPAAPLAIVERIHVPS
ncbi:MAG: polyprenyl synthetase family protein [Pirellulaceae bacterium]